MNELKKLQEQSGLQAYYDSQQRNIEKFAELIVKECAQSLWTDECHVSDLAVEEFNLNSKRIKEHFGVK